MGSVLSLSLSFDYLHLLSPLLNCYISLLSCLARGMKAFLHSPGGNDHGIGDMSLPFIHLYAHLLQMFYMHICYTVPKDSHRNPHIQQGL